MKHYETISEHEAFNKYYELEIDELFQQSLDPEIGKVYLVDGIHEKIVHSILFIRACEAGDLDMVKYAMNNATSIRIEYMISALNSSAMLGNIDIVKFLIEECNVPVNSKIIKSGETPITCACMGGNIFIVKYLIENGADLQAENTIGNLLFNSIMYPDIISYLLYSGLNPNVKNFRFQNPLHCACELDNYEVCCALIDYGININAMDEDGKTPLMVSIPSFSVLIPELLISSGANPNIIDKNGNSALIHAVLSGDLSSVKLLVEYGANINHRNRDGMNALTIAYQADVHDEKIIELLRYWGAE